MLKTQSIKYLFYILLFAVISCGKSKSEPEVNSKDDGYEITDEVEEVDEGTVDTSWENVEVEDRFICPEDCQMGTTFEEEGHCPICGKDLILETGSVNDSQSDESEDENDESEDEGEGKDQIKNKN